LACLDAVVAKAMRKGQHGQLEVHRIEESTQTELRFSNRGEYLPNTQYRTLKISGGDAESICSALACVLELYEASADIEVCCVVMPTLAGMLDSYSGPDVTAASLHEVYGDHELVSVHGQPQAVTETVLDMCRTLQTLLPDMPDWAHMRLTGDGESSRNQTRRRPERRSWPTRSSPPPARRGGGNGGREHRSEAHIDTTIFVGRLAQATREEDLRSYFEQFGEVTDADVRIDQGTSRSKGYGFITFADRFARDRCLDTRDHTVSGRRVDVKKYDPNEVGSAAAPPRGRQPARRDRDHGQHVEGPRNLADWYLARAAEMKANLSSQMTSMSFQLPSNMIGPLMGKGGVQLREVEAQTTASVSIEKDADREGNRRVEISGEAMAIYAAHVMLMKYYHDGGQDAPPRPRNGPRPQERDYRPPRGGSDVRRGGSAPAARDEAAEKAAEVQRLKEELLQKQQELHRAQAAGSARASSVPLRTGVRYSAGPRRS